MTTSIQKQSLSNQKNIRELGKKTENAMGKSEQNFNARTYHTLIDLFLERPICSRDQHF